MASRRAARASSSGLVWCLNAGDEAVGVDPLIQILLENPEIDMAYGDYNLLGQVIRAKPAPITKATLRWHGMCFSHCSVAYRKNLHDRFGFYPGEYSNAMDFAFLALAIVGGARLAYVRKPIALIEPAGISSSLVNRNLEGMRALLPFTPKPLAYAILCKWIVFQSAGATLRKWRLRGEPIEASQTARVP